MHKFPHENFRKLHDNGNGSGGLADPLTINGCSGAIPSVKILTIQS